MTSSTCICALCLYFWCTAARLAKASDQMRMRLLLLGLIIIQLLLLFLSLFLWPDIFPIMDAVAVLAHSPSLIVFHVSRWHDSILRHQEEENPPKREKFQIRSTHEGRANVYAALTLFGLSLAWWICTLTYSLVVNMDSTAGTVSRTVQYFMLGFAIVSQTFQRLYTPSGARRGVDAGSSDLINGDESSEFSSGDATRLSSISSSHLAGPCPSVVQQL
ncbi:uncharacterized protein B0I36DRAFT_46639 [Microdochium trichocladiopsis]|uniref:Uncharacterized protein n=1 Tax=Microdochium trichocladiopsis TaxID=1682393 RepID=A0A9P8XT53_9PEZI|nr:uncharacterized protein B0I36DRAFT_46639 [Microdochium trichocladiopsis]KAH7016483.1 hypothetical protein B0I36DRAFT_46639 [Microdochium trichocladiopsis]